MFPPLQKPKTSADAEGVSFHKNSEGREGHAPAYKSGWAVQTGLWEFLEGSQYLWYLACSLGWGPYPLRLAPHRLPFLRLVPTLAL